MAVREFTDSRGRQWRAWDIKPEDIRPVTRGEDYLADCYVTGWIVFETMAGDEKRRLCPWPKHWTLETEGGLRRLLEMAERVPFYKMRSQQQPGAHSLTAPMADTPGLTGEKPDVTDLGVVRAFRYPGGRVWTVCVVSEPDNGGAPVLRFTSGARTIDVKSWPKAWTDEPDEGLAMLLRNGAPRDPASTFHPNTPRRRWSDSPQVKSP